MVRTPRKYHSCCVHDMHVFSSRSKVWLNVKCTSVVNSAASAPVSHHKSPPRVSKRVHIAILVAGIWPRSNVGVGGRPNYCQTSLETTRNRQLRAPSSPHSGVLNANQNKDCQHIAAQRHTTKARCCWPTQRLAVGYRQNTREVEIASTARCFSHPSS